MYRPRGLFILESPAYDMVFGPAEREAIERHVDLVAPPQTRETIASRMDLLQDVEVIFSGWGAPLMDEAFLAAAPRLKVVFYAAGAIGYFCTPAVWDRGVQEWREHRDEIIAAYPEDFAVRTPEEVAFLQDWLDNRFDWFVPTTFLDEEWADGEQAVFDLMRETGFVEEDAEEPSFPTLEPTS